MYVVKRAFARIGLLGNPSDGYNGKTISVSVANFWAEVSLSLYAPAPRACASLCLHMKQVEPQLCADSRLFVGIDQPGLPCIHKYVD